MPRLVSEITSGAQFSRSQEDGVVADSQTRTFRVMLREAGEYVNIPEACGIRIGDQHPSNTNIYCSSFDGRYDGESRMTLVCTFSYQSKAGSSDGGEDAQSKPPDVRPANWSVSSTVYEVPAGLWLPQGNAPGAGDGWAVPANPVGDRYDGVMKVEPIVTFSIEQYENTNPARHVTYVGVVNSSAYSIGSFTAPPKSLMFKGVQCQPVVESWGDMTYRGWKATYEFVYKSNYAGEDLGNIGWDIAIPQTGFNIINKSAALGGGVHEVGSLALKHSVGKIKNWPDDPDLVPGTDGRKVRGMVLVASYESGGASQTPCAQPIPLNDDGTPRSSGATPPVKVYRYQVQPGRDFGSFGIRLQ